MGMESHKKVFKTEGARMYYAANIASLKGWLGRKYRDLAQRLARDDVGSEVLPTEISVNPWDHVGPTGAPPPSELVAGEDVLAKIQEVEPSSGSMSDEHEAEWGSTANPLPFAVPELPVWDRCFQCVRLWNAGIQRRCPKHQGLPDDPMTTSIRKGLPQSD
jgi:hypothetical protein